MTIRIGLVGLGYWGPNLARVIAASEGGELAALCDTDAARLARFGRLYPTAKAIPDADGLFGDGAIDAVVLATPVDTHYSLARAALEGHKHVLVEKPLAQTSTEGADLIQLAESRGLVLMTGHVFLYNAAVRKIREYIAAGELGEIYYLYSQRLNFGQVRPDVNALWNFAPHDLSIFSAWLGTGPQRVIARGYSYLQPGIEDVVFMTLDYPGGIGANVHISWLDPHKVRLMTVVGSDKMVVYDDVSAEAKIRLYDKGVTRRLIKEHPADAVLGRFETFAEFQLLLRAGDVLIPKLEFSEPLQVEIEDFVAAITTGRRPVSDGQVGLDVVRALEAAERSLASAGSPVAI